MEQIIGLSSIILFVILIRFTRVAPRTKRAIFPVLQVRHVIFDQSLNDLQKEAATKQLAISSLRELLKLILSLIVVIGLPTFVVFFSHLFQWVHYRNVFTYLFQIEIIFLSLLLSLLALLKK